MYEARKQTFSRRLDKIDFPKPQSRQLPQAPPTKLKRTLHLRVSIEAGNAIHGGLGTEQREAALDIVRNIVDRYISRGWEGAC
jgi:hypothetical protein